MTKIAIPEQELRQAVADRLSTRQIAAKFGTSAGTINKLLKKCILKTNPIPLFDRPGHREKCSAASKANWQNSEYRNKVIDADKQAHSSAGQIEKCSSLSKANWQNSEYRNKCLTAMRTPEYKDKLSAISRANWADKEYRAEREAVMGTPECREKRSKAAKLNWENAGYRANNAATRRSPEFRSKSIAISKASWMDAEYKIRTIAAMNTQEIIDKASSLSKALWANPEYKNKRMAAMNTPEYKRQASLISKGLWRNERYKNKCLASVRSSDYRANMAIAARLRWEDPQYRVKHLLAISTPEAKSKMAKARENMPWSMTKPHQKVCDILTSLGVKFEIEKAVGFWNFDLYLPDFNLLIEVQGNYWHTLAKAKSRDKAKSTYIERYHPELKIGYIWEHECLQPNKVLEKIKYWCGLTKLELVDYEFKDLRVGQVNKNIADEFLYTWHYQHHGRHGVDYGVYLGEQLIAISRFTSPTRNESATQIGLRPQEVLELARLCVHPRYQKKNLLTWALARIEKDIKKSNTSIRCLVSFSDMSQGHTGAVYKAANWEFHSVADPSYYYVDKDGYVMHKKTLWDHAKKLCMKEAEYAESHGFVKVPTLEKHKFIRRL